MGGIKLHGRMIFSVMLPNQLSERVRQIVKYVQDWDSVILMEKKNRGALWLVWLSGLSAGLQKEKLPVWFPVRADVWGGGQVPS